jgi:hypothetical protein
MQIQLPFEENGVLGRLSQPAILKTRVWWSKKYLSIKDGLVSMNVIDANF